MSNFANDRHNLYVGWVLGIALRNDLPAVPGVDAEGNYTDQIVLNLKGRAITVVVPEPPEDWTLDEEDVIACPACGAKAELRSRVWWETSHDTDCAWLNDPEAEPYS